MARHSTGRVAAAGDRTVGKANLKFVTWTAMARTRVALAGGGAGCSHPESIRQAMIAPLRVHAMVFAASVGLTCS
jgi:hypothetical protein